MFYFNTFISFFDDFENPQKLWRATKKEEKLITNFQPYLSGIFSKQGKTTRIWKKRMYYLTTESLIYTNDKDSKRICKVLDFDIDTRMKFIGENDPDTPKDFKGGFLIMRNRNHHLMYTNNLIQLETWRRELSSKCTLHSFHNDYEVLRLLGKGSFAKVFLAKQKESQKEFAVKAFSKEYLSSQDRGRSSLMNEVKIMKKLSHPNILKLIEVHESENSIYLIMELIRGGELVKRLKISGFSDSDRKKLMRNLLSALSHIHKKNIMHRDLKPENILLKSQDDMHSIVLADFGLAAFLKEDSKKLLFKRCGTPGFVAPEILFYKDGCEMYNEKCDIFSAGIIFYFIISGRRPFDGKDFKQIIQENKRCQISFEQPIFKKVNNEAMDLLQKMLKFNPSERPSAEEAINHKYFSIVGTYSDFSESTESLQSLSEVLEFMKNYQTIQYDPEECDEIEPLYQSHHSKKSDQGKIAEKNPFNITSTEENGIMKHVFHNNGNASNAQAKFDNEILPKQEGFKNMSEETIKGKLIKSLGEEKMEYKVNEVLEEEEEKSNPNIKLGNGKGKPGNEDEVPDETNNLQEKLSSMVLNVEYDKSLQSMKEISSNPRK